MLTAQYLPPASSQALAVACSHKKCVVNSTPENHTAKNLTFFCLNAYKMGTEMINTLISVVSSQLSTLLRGILSLHTACLAGEFQERDYSAIGTWMFVLPPNKHNKQVLHNFSGELAELIFKVPYPVNFQVKSTYSKCQDCEIHTYLYCFFSLLQEHHCFQ